MKNKTFYILKKELREVFRDKKSLAMMLVIPIMIPFIMIGISYMFDSEMNKEINEYNKIGFTYSLSDEELHLIKLFEIDSHVDDKSEIKKLYDDEKIYVYIEKKDNVYTINYDKDNPNCAATAALAESYLNQYKMYLQNVYLSENNINSSEVLNIIDVKFNSVGKKETNFYANYITTYSFLFVLMAITISATYPATDTTAGEKERGTMETLLTFPIKNKDIIIGKYLSVSLSSIITGLLGFVLSIFSLAYASKNISIYEGINLIPSAATLVFSILIIICYSLLVSGLCIAIASLFKTFKESQSALTPLTFISIFPGMISLMSDMKTTNLISVIPFLNFVQIFNDVNASNIDILQIVLMFISTIIYISIVFVLIINQYKSEKVLFNS